MMEHLQILSPDHLHQLTVKLYQAGDYDNAHACASYLRQIDPLNSKSYKILGQVNQANEAYSWAIGAYQRAVIFDALDTESQYNMAQCYAYLKEYDKAMKWLKACIAIDPECDKARKMLESLEKNIC